MTFTNKGCINNTSSSSCFMSSPMNTCDDSNDIYSSSPEPTHCDCQNQLGHWDWNGTIREDLPELCKKTMGITPENRK